MPRRNRKIRATAKYTVPVSERTEAGAKRLDRKGRLRRGFKYTDGSNTSGRIPLATVAKPPRMARRRRAVGQITPSGRGKTKIY